MTLKEEFDSVDAQLKQLYESHKNITIELQGVEQLMAGFQEIRDATLIAYAFQCGIPAGELNAYYREESRKRAKAITIGEKP